LLLLLMVVVVVMVLVLVAAACIPRHDGLLALLKNKFSMYCFAVLTRAFLGFSRSYLHLIPPNCRIFLWSRHLNAR
jgi:ABC-type Co2+ transport system permease subunit